MSEAKAEFDKKLAQVDGGTRKVWMPEGTIVRNPESHHTTTVIVSESGVGKSFLVRQLLEDEDYGKDEVLVLNGEDASMVYKHPYHELRAYTLGETAGHVAELHDAAREGRPLPKVLVWDSMSGTMDRERKIVRMLDDKRAGFGDMGYGAIDLLGDMRELPMDVIIMVTSFMGPQGIELAVEGRLTPRNLARKVNMVLAMLAETVEVPEGKTASPAPHRTIGRFEDGTPDGTVINRFFYTMYNGEVRAKGHDSLNTRERAILPDVLRKIHGKEAK